MDKPQIADAPGLAWRPRKNGWAAVWLSRQDIAKKGFKPSTKQLGMFTSQPTEDEADTVALQCQHLQEAMYAFGNEQPKVFGGTVRALIDAYHTDKDSPYHGMRYKSRGYLDSLVKRVDAKFGDAKLADLGARDFKQWYKAFRFPDGEEGRQLVTTAHAVMTTVRMMLSFGSVFEIEKSPRDRISECSRLRVILHDMKFENKKPRTEAMTWRQCEDIIAAANEAGLHSIALTQALQFDLRARQKDIIGEWVPASEPGISVIAHRLDRRRVARKWLRGLRWEEISSTMKLSHPMSKSRTGKVLDRDLSIYPMIMAELDKIPADKRTGPVIVCEITGRPWTANLFRLKWRELATSVGVPKAVFNMDSRAGGITETIEANGGNLEAARKEAEHSDIKTTAGYSRRKQEAVKANAVQVLDFRAKNRA